jgi:lipoteichoic acid synthase
MVKRMILERLKQVRRIASRRAVWLSLWALALVWALVQIDGHKVRMRWTNHVVVTELGFVGYAVYDIGKWVAVSMDDLDDVDPAPYREFLKSRRQGDPPPKPSVGPRKNVIFLQLESIDAITLTADVGGEPAMPFLKELSAKSLVFENALDQTGAGRSSDAHVLALSSLIPIQNMAVFTRYDLSKTPSLPRVLNGAGYHTFSIEGTYGTFWRWKKNHERLGFDESYAREDLDDSETIGLGISDCSLLEQAAAKLVAAPKPVFAYVVLLTHHHPYSAVHKQQGKPDQGIVKNYFVSARYVDGCIRGFFESLRAQGLLQETLISIYSDHDSGITSDLHAHVGRDYDGRVLSERIPWMVTGAAHTGRISRATGLSDVSPTILVELGLPIPSTFVGLPGAAPGGDVLLQNGTRVRLGPDGEMVVEALDDAMDLGILTRLVIQRPELLEESR